MSTVTYLIGPALLRYHAALVLRTQVRDVRVEVDARSRKTLFWYLNECIAVLDQPVTCKAIEEGFAPYLVIKRLTA